MKQENTDLRFKKDTLKAWTRILYRQGQIDLAKCNRMLLMIEKLTA